MSSTPPQRKDCPPSGERPPLRPDEGDRSRHLRIDHADRDAEHSPHLSIARPRLTAARRNGGIASQVDSVGLTDISNGVSSASGQSIDSAHRMDTVRIDSDHGAHSAYPSTAKAVGVRAPEAHRSGVLRSASDPANAGLRTDYELDEQAKLSASDRVSERHRWLRLHASDLIDRIQHWSDSIDSRESSLNARSAQQDRRERQFRLKQQDLAVELDEQRRSIERLRLELETQTRRLAFLDSV